jgi:hypothetical protein
MNPNNDLRRATYDAEQKSDVRDRDAERAAALHRSADPKPGLLARISASVRGLIGRT